MMKRIFDLICSIMGLMILWPLLLLVALLIKLKDPGPILFRQERIGRYGKPFLILKFRTMVVNAESLGRSITVGHDPRITPFGQALRKTKIDELPQLFNVLLGEMSFVGPRPEVPYYVSLYSEAQREALQLRPGITDLASLKYRNENEILQNIDAPDDYYIHTIMPDKLRINLAYAKTSSVITDLRVILCTLGLGNALQDNQDT